MARDSNLKVTTLCGRCAHQMPVYRPSSCNNDAIIDSTFHMTYILASAGAHDGARIDVVLLSEQRAIDHAGPANYHRQKWMCIIFMKDNMMC